MLKRLRLIALINAVEVLKYLLNIFNSALTNQTLDALEKSNSSYSISFLFDRPCTLDDTMSEDNTRESLRTWESRTIIGDQYGS